MTHSKRSRRGGSRRAARQPGSVGRVRSAVRRLGTRWSAVIGVVGTMVTFLGFNGLLIVYDRVFGGDEAAFVASLGEARGRLEDPSAGEAGRLTAIGDLQRLGADPPRAGRVGEVLQAFVGMRTRPDPGAAGACGSTTDPAGRVGAGAAPVDVSRAFVALAAVTRAEGEGGRVRLPGAGLARVQADSVWLTGADLTAACLVGAELAGAELAGAELGGAILDGANLSGARLDGAHVEEASLAEVNLNHARLVHARLTWAELPGASLVGARLDLALLGGATLDGADLSGASLAGAYLEGASLEAVRHWEEVRDFEGAYLHAVEGLTAEQVRFAADRGAITTRLTQREWQEHRHELAAERGLVESERRPRRRSWWPIRS